MKAFSAKGLLCASVLVLGLAGAIKLRAFNPQPDPPGFGMFGVTQSQSTRLAVVQSRMVPPDPYVPCGVRLSYFDASGNLLRSSGAKLDPGQSAFLSLRSSDLGLRELRSELLPYVEAEGSCNLAASVEVFDNETGKTTSRSQTKIVRTAQ